jgi:hypothetical protein
LISFFKDNGKIDISLVAAFVLIHALIFANAWRRDPTIGYDAFSHRDYIQALAKGHLVMPNESDEFFCPLLPYIFPSVLVATDMDVFKAMKLAQFLQALLSIFLFVYLIKICRLISPNTIVSLGAVIFTGILPVYYKTFAFVRGEPYVAFFATAGIYYFLKIFIGREYNWRNTVAAGVVLGCCMLSRQWGVLLVPALGAFAALCWFREREFRVRIFKATAISLVIAFAISGWFYLWLRSTTGAATAFNREPSATFSLHNQPSSFYFGLAPKELFSRAVRPNFPNEFIPIFYSETWGDYWGFFALFGQDTRKPNERRLTGPWLSKYEVWNGAPDWMATNYESMSAYLGRVNLVSLFPTLLALVALTFALREAIAKPSLDLQANPQRLLLLITVFSFAGYFWFLIKYPVPEKGDTIKASYMLHVFPLIAVCVGLFLEKIQKRSRLIPRLIVFCFIAVAAHNIAAMITHYRWL